MAELAPELIVDQWFNVEVPLTLTSLRGKVVAIEAFQMLCPGCVSHGLPQAQKIAETFRGADVVVLGLHSVFEHHSAMTPTSLEAFLYEYRINFPVAVDKAGTDRPVPQTMERYKLRGTPSLLLIDRNGILRANYFGQVDDMKLGAEITALLKEKDSVSQTSQAPSSGLVKDGECDDSGCAIDH